MMIMESYKALKAAAELFTDCQDFRKSMENKARSGQVDPQLVAIAAEHYKVIEHAASKAMVAELRVTVPATVLAWRKGSPGVGEHYLAKLLGCIGDPYVAVPMRWETRAG